MNRSSLPLPSAYFTDSTSSELGGSNDTPPLQVTYPNGDTDADEFQNVEAETEEVAPLALTLERFVAGQLSMHTRRAYAQDARLFVEWLAQHNLTLATLTGSDFQLYRRHLSDTFAKTTAARKLVVARKLLDAAVERGLLAVNPAKLVKGFSGSTPEDNQTGYVALELEQARELLRTVDTTTKQGKRDWVIRKSDQFCNNAIRTGKRY